MTHARKQIRDAVILELSDMADEGYLVTARRVSSLEPNELPAILVSVGVSEESVPVTMGSPPVIERTATLLVAGICKEDEPFLDDLLESIAENVETLITQTHGGLCKSTMLTTTAKEYDAIGDTAVAGISLTFTTIYHTAADAPGTAL
jgi:hypothetical protein